MSAPNGHAEGSQGRQFDSPNVSPPAGSLTIASAAQFTPEQIRRFVDLLEIPFDGAVIEWRVTNTTKRSGNLRGQVIPYADQRAYTDRLNALFTPAGWTRKYTVHTTSNFQRDEDQKLVAKVFLTCEVTIFGLGSHSATGEEWTDDENAVTSAEAQAFKRACSCFGLGRYLYYFSGLWLDLDERNRPFNKPELTGWATPQGWREGQRPRIPEQETPKGNVGSDGEDELIHQVEGMAETLRKGLYRGILKTVARVWTPRDIQDVALLSKVLKYMQAGERGLKRLEAVLEETDPDVVIPILRSLGLKSLDQIHDLETLREVVLALESRK